LLHYFTEVGFSTKLAEKQFWKTNFALATVGHLLSPLKVCAGRGGRWELRQGEKREGQGVGQTEQGIILVAAKMILGYHSTSLLA